MLPLFQGKIITFLPLFQGKIIHRCTCHDRPSSRMRGPKTGTASKIVLLLSLGIQRPRTLAARHNRKDPWSPHLKRFQKMVGNKVENKWRIKSFTHIVTYAMTLEIIEPNPMPAGKGSTKHPKPSDSGESGRIALRLISRVSPSRVLFLVKISTPDNIQNPIAARGRNGCNGFQTRYRRVHDHPGSR